MAEQCREVKTRARAKYWADFVSNIHNDTSSTIVWRKINIARGTKTQAAAHENPRKKAEELVDEWAAASTVSNLPERIRNKIEVKSSIRKRHITNAISTDDDSCVDITEYELLHAIKKGKSTAPGEDGITYDILSALVMVEGKPLLKLFNMIYRTGKIPYHWKNVIIVPVPKPGDPESFRPISLASCYCKMMERILLNRLLSKIGPQLSPNLNGFIEGRSTSNCIATYLANEKAKFSVFLDLKGAFDRANRQIILYQLAQMGVKGKLLAWIRDYLTDRKGYVHFQGRSSTVREFELGTPQGGVLSPTLFNVLMNVIATTQLPKGASIVVYADDILIQARTYIQMQKSLDIIGEVCDNLGFVVSTVKTKAMSTIRGQEKELVLLGDKLEYVNVYKYLGIYVGGAQGKGMLLQKTITTCKTRLRPLKAMAYGCQGASVTILRMMYLAYVRSVIDYAAPALICLSKSQLGKLETIQNEAARIILGCPPNVKTENLRLELGLTTVTDRIREINSIIGLKSLRDVRETLTKSELLNHLGTDLVTGNGWSAITARDMIHYSIHEFDLTVRMYGAVIPPWEVIPVNVIIDRPPFRKADMSPLELKPHYAELIEKASVAGEHLDQLYCDGSLNTVTGHAGSAVTLMNGGKFQADHELQVRLHDWASTTQSELMAILLALKQIGSRLRNSLILSDSLTALQTLKKKGTPHQGLVNVIMKKIRKLDHKGVSVKFIWIPSHVGIPGNERADILAKEATQKGNVDYNLGVSVQQVKTRIKEVQILDNYENRQRQGNQSRSIQYYDTVALKTCYKYGMKGVSRHRDMVMARLRLGYLYPWQVMGAREGESYNCKVCNQADSHTLHHYIMSCPMIQEYRNLESVNIESQVKHLLSKNLVNKILKQFKGFAYPR